MRSVERSGHGLTGGTFAFLQIDAEVGLSDLNREGERCPAILCVLGGSRVFSVSPPVKPISFCITRCLTNDLLCVSTVARYRKGVGS